MTEEEKTEKTEQAEEVEAEAAEQAPAVEEEAAPEEAPAAEAPAEKAEEPEAKEAPAKAEPEEELSRKERRQLERSRAGGPARPKRSPEERATERAERRGAAKKSRRRHRASRRARRGDPKQGTPPAERDRPAVRKTRQGVVSSSKADKTIAVRVEIVRRHTRYEKVVRRSHTIHAHDERNEASDGDLVRVVESRPMSRAKRWRLVEVLQRAPVRTAGIEPSEELEA